MHILYSIIAAMNNAWTPGFVYGEMHCIVRSSSSMPRNASRRAELLHPLVDWRTLYPACFTALSLYYFAHSAVSQAKQGFGNGGRKS